MKTNCKRQAGFSLIEMAIVITISGLLLTGFLQLYRIQVEKHRFDVTKTRLESLRVALTDYAATHEQLPCPASPAAGGGNSCAPDSGQSPGVVAATIGAPVMGRDQTLEVWIGVVPAHELRLDADAGRDGWDRPFTYAVSRRLTLPQGMRGNPIPTGIISVVDADGNSMLDKPGTGRYVIISHGPSGDGAWTPSGKRAPCPAGTLDARNCQDTGVFVAAPFAQAHSAAFYDNLLIYDNSDAGGNLVNRIAVCNLKHRFYIPADADADNDGCVRDKNLWQGACLLQFISDWNGVPLPSVPKAVMAPAVANGSSCACSHGFTAVLVGSWYDTSDIFPVSDKVDLPENGMQHTQTALYTCTQ